MNIQKKIGIMTINSINLGNRLQNYALQKVLQTYDYNVQTIRRRYSNYDNGEIKGVKDILRIIIGSRKGKYYDFNRKYISYSKQYAGENNIDTGIMDSYDVIIAGSDQVWNPNYSFVGTSDLLLFETRAKKISYAASFGVDAIPENKKGTYRKALADFSSISVRETEGSEIVNDLLGVRPSVVLDPTFLLEKERWSELAKKPQYAPKGKYVLYYFLKGEDFPNRQDEQNNTKGKDKLEVFDIMKRDKNGKLPSIGPQEFLWLISNSEKVMTNSFHAAVFSIIFEKPVEVFKRSGMDMSSRIITLTNVFDFEMGRGDCLLSIIDQDKLIHAKSKLHAARKESLHFLLSAIEE